MGDFVEKDADTEDKINFDRMNHGLPGLKTDGVKRAKLKKMMLNKDQPIDVYHKL